tara:strand:- start:495 stop:926 length:432 start_codon:yes stop_codon:yes gene_type:complete
MGGINIRKLISDLNLSKKELAKELFPHNKYPVLSLNRVMKGETFLDSNQISRLSALTGVSVENLFDQANWKADIRGRVIIFTDNKFKAHLHVDTFKTEMLYEGVLFHESILHSNDITLKNYIRMLDRHVRQHRNWLKAQDNNQ